MIDCSSYYVPYWLKRYCLCKGGSVSLKFFNKIESGFRTPDSIGQKLNQRLQFIDLNEMKGNE